MITPLNADGSVDKAALGRLAERLLAAEVDGIFVLGSCGEGPSLSDSEAARAIEGTVQTVGGRVPVLAGVIASSTERVLEKIADSYSLGADAAVVTSPFYYSSYQDEEIAAYFQHITEKSRLPIVIYNIPQMTKIWMKPELILRLSKVPSILGIKDSLGDWAHFQKLLFQREDPSFKIFQGAELLSGVSLLFGADGIVPGIGNINPALAVRLYRAAKGGSVQKVLVLQKEMDQLCRVFEVQSWLPALKSAMSLLGICSDHVTRPFEKLGDPEKKLIAAIIQSNGLGLKAFDEKSQSDDAQVPGYGEPKKKSC